MIIKVDVNVSAPELAESISQLAAVFPKTIVENEEPKKEVSAEPKKEDEPKKKTTRRASSKKAEAKQPAVKEETAKEITVEEVRAKLAALSQEGKQAQVKKLITELGAKKLSDVPKEKYQELFEKASVL